MNLMETKKKCTKCGELKPLKDYYKEDRYTTGFRAACKSCTNPSRLRLRYEADIYERCLARFLIARNMIRLGEIQQASDYINAIDPTVYDYAQYTRRRDNDHDYRGLKYLVRYVFIEIESIHLKPSNGERRDTDRQFYLNKLQKYGWAVTLIFGLLI